MDILGIDEAGRGSVLGPLVIAGVVIPDKKENILDNMGVKDSKKLTPERREILSRKLKKMFEWDTVIYSASDIDSLRAKGVNLNEIERKGMQELILKLKSDMVIVDAVDVKPERFQDKLERATKANVKAEHKADDTYIEVGAASIIAKHTRDVAIAEINRDFADMGGIGSGYPSDPTTKKFLSNYTYNEMPDFVRKSWSTVAKLKDVQTTLI
ncbi:ribonuclease HII [Methanobrevibacter millerae]|uniref:Ribonuclease HII n=1 Tax=Methanobrevibacter millerae TaxID=230361 RepID=A0A1G5VCH1_9EURY|nr:ribonuclease HII [Methanobrevibacter millerae]SDA42735.1 RNase HII [Methanobrevibacter millerae]